MPSKETILQRANAAFKTAAPSGAPLSSFDAIKRNAAIIHAKSLALAQRRAEARAGDAATPIATPRPVISSKSGT